MADSLSEAAANFLQAKLQAFLSRNPEADFRSGEHEFSVSGPWGEEAIEIPLRNDDDELIEALNAVRLPPRFTAIWHEDSREFEVIFTVLRNGNHLLERSFEFHYKGNCYHCSFGPSSQRLRAIAQKARPSGSVSRSDYRNLLPFYRFEHLLEERPDTEYVKSGKPTSFWIRGIDSYDDDRISELARNLNFHMSYFDQQTPTILIHEEPVASHRANDRHLPHVDTFPDTLSVKDIDQHLLILWQSAGEGETFLRFLHYYHILEYAGFYHVKDQVRREVERALAAPDAMSRPEKVAQQILDAISADRRPDEAKINSMVEECMDSEEMWYVLRDSLADFSKEVKLDGGFTLPALVSASIGYEEFVGSWNGKFTTAFASGQKCPGSRARISAVYNDSANHCQSREIVSLASSTVSNGSKGHAIQ